MEKIAGCQDLFLIVVYNGDDVAHAWVEFHVPRAFPFSELVKVFLTLGHPGLYFFCTLGCHQQRV